MRALWREHLTLWESWSTGPIQELIEEGDPVLVFHPLRLRSKRGLAPASNDAAAAFTFSNGRVIRILATDSAKALEVESCA